MSYTDALKKKKKKEKLRANNNKNAVDILISVVSVNNLIRLFAAKQTKVELFSSSNL